MSGRGTHGGHGGRVSIESGPGCGCVHGYTGANIALKKGLFANLDNSMFYYGHKAAAGQMRTSW